MPQPQEQQQRVQARVAPASQLQGQQQQQQQQQPQEKRPVLRGRWVPGTSGLVLSGSLPLRQVPRFLLKVSPFCCQGSSPRRFFHHRWLVGWYPGGLSVDSNGDSGCGTLRYSDLCQPSGARRDADRRVISRLSSAQRCGGGGTCGGGSSRCG